MLKPQSHSSHMGLHVSPPICVRMGVELFEYRDGRGHTETLEGNTCYKDTAAAPLLPSTEIKCFSCQLMYYLCLCVCEHVTS